MFLRDFNLVGKNIKCITRKEALDIYQRNSHLRRHMKLTHFKKALKEISLKIYDISKESELGLPISILSTN